MECKLSHSPLPGVTYKSSWCWRPESQLCSSLALWLGKFLNLWNIIFLIFKMVMVSPVWLILQGCSEKWRVMGRETEKFMRNGMEKNSQWLPRIYKTLLQSSKCSLHWRHSASFNFSPTISLSLFYSLLSFGKFWMLHFMKISLLFLVC